MRITFGLETAAETDATVVPLFEEQLAEGALPFDLPPGFAAQPGEATWFYGRGGDRHYLLAWLGKASDAAGGGSAGWSAGGGASGSACGGSGRSGGLERLRMAAGAASRALRRPGFRSAAVALDFARWLRPHADLREAAAAWVEGWRLGAYRYDAPGRPRPPGEAAAERLHLLAPADAELTGAIETASHRAEATMLARDLVNAPGDRLNPDAFVRRIAERFEGREGVRIAVYRGEELARRRMNGLLTVGRGSAHEPALVELVYEPTPGGEPPIVLIGKGVTFDMGGLNVKTAPDLADARMDMGGAAAVVGALELLLRTGAKRNVVALLPIADNVPDARACLPGEVIDYPNGLTVEVKNTDAEGRLMLADALLHAASFAPAAVVDIATLTGNVGQALGLGIAGVWGDDAVAAELAAAAETSGDRLWPMPMPDEYAEQLHSDFADLANWAPAPYGGAILAALFLKRFASGGGYPWAHIDMANTAQARRERGYTPVGATGYGVRLLADYIMRAQTPVNGKEVRA